MNLNELRDRAYSIAKEHGWHDEEHSDETYLMLVITELAEAVNADRSNKHSDVAKFKEWQGNNIPLSEETSVRRFKEDFEAYIKDSVDDELADVVIRCLDFAGVRGWDLQHAIEYKLNNNDLPDLFSYKTFTHICFHICARIFMAFDEEDATRNVIINVLRYCDYKGIDIEWHIEQKMKYNQLRSHKHVGKKY